MHFQLTEEQRALRDGTRELLAGRFGRDALRAAVDADTPAVDRGLWRELGEAGLFSLCLPESEGGVGLGLPDAVVVFEEVGRALVPGPLVATFLAAAEVPGAAAGETVVTAPYGSLLPWRDDADVVRGDASRARPIASADPLTPLHALPEPAPVPLEATLLYAAEQLGSAGRTLDMAVQHAREREQFGSPIGSFQAVKHLCAEMLVRVEVARAAVYAAAVTADPVEVAAAELLADEAAVQGARDCLQVHGGMGFTWEADVHLHLKRAWVRAELGGSARDAEETLAAAL
ncbi:MULTISPECIES: acyl-CoA dehydrogenase family protein [unclassified Streptomyces]|uniref:acyl-CoA dehydrogenase family protein n=1 Tax=unclassified Streptomyces TaxID=2593676 RepID=UPI002E17EBC1